MNGCTVKLITCTGEHGMKTQHTAAAKESIPVQQICDSVTNK